MLIVNALQLEKKCVCISNPFKLYIITLFILKIISKILKINIYEIFILLLILLFNYFIIILFYFYNFILKNSLVFLIS